jgi:hypothetical protein
MVPPPYAELFDQIAARRGDGSVVLPFSDLARGLYQ